MRAPRRYALEQRLARHRSEVELGRDQVVAGVDQVSPGLDPLALRSPSAPPYLAEGERSPRLEEE